MSLRSPLAVLLLLLTAACGDTPPAPPPGGGGGGGRPALAETYRPTGRMAAGDVMVHLFEWKWTDIATECVQVLGPAGVRAVQVSPPQEHSLEPPNYPWSERYQPVSYSIERSRSGTGDEFRSMVATCRTAGVGIIVDAVINHMTNYPSPGVGSNGSSYSKYDYPGLYTQADFHTPCALNNYQSAANVQDCELFSLPDLNTRSNTVRQRIADYLIMLARAGVEGFRVDAAKHIQQVDLDSIFWRVNTTLAGEGRALPYVFLEFVGNGQGEALAPRDYYGVGYASGGAADLTDFTFTGVGDKFRRVGGQFIAQLNPNGPPGAQFSEAAWGLLPTDKAVAFLQNHDTQHQCGIGYRNGNAFRMANVWMLAQPYGYPSVLSSYAFDCPLGNSMGPPGANGVTADVTCAPVMETAVPGQWVCEHRDPSVRAMIGFRRTVAGTAITRWWDNGASAIAFSRGAMGFVAINNEAVQVTATVATDLAPGTYCDRLTGGLAGAACAGTTVTVTAGGTVQVDLAPGTAIAIDITTHL